MSELLPVRTWFPPGTDVEVELRCTQPLVGTLRVERLATPVLQRAVGLPPGRHRIGLGSLPRGGYAVSLTADDHEAATAVDVLDDPFERPRYGFVAAFPPDRQDIEGVLDDLRRLHLSVVQFYDWMYRHDDLIGPDEVFVDPLGRRLSHAVTRQLVTGVRGVGSVPMAYAAVYGVSPGYADDHPDQLLYRSDGSRWTLGDLLAIADPTPGRRWVGRFIGQLAEAVEAIGFGGFHLDQYGWPKLALRADGSLVDLAAAFPALFTAIRAALPDARLIFNNVNDFPTEATASAAQDATYIEVWPPNETYADLAALIGDAHLRGPGRAAILAAYLEPFRDDPVERAEAAAQLTLATILAHGGSHLLCGEEHGVLVDPYYPNFRTVGDGTFELLRRHLDAAVALGDLLYDDGPVVTRAWFDGFNDEVRVEAPVAVGHRGEPGTVWLVVRRGADHLTVHLIDLSDQVEAAWNRGKAPLTSCADVAVAVSLPVDPAEVVFAEPAAGCRARTLPWKRDGDHIRVEVPAFTGWAVISVRSPSPR